KKVAAEEFEIVARLQKRQTDHDLARSNMILDLGRGLKAMEAGDLGMSVMNFRSAVAADPDSTEAHNHLGVALAKTGDVEGAIAEFRKAIELQPSESSAYNNLGGLLAASGKLENAIDQLREAIRRNA